MSQLTCFLQSGKMCHSICLLMVILLLQVQDASGVETKEHCTSGICYYELDNTGVTWEEAKNRCENTSSTLVSIISEEIQNVVQGLLRQQNVSVAWTGGTVRNEGRWLTLDGSTVSPDPIIPPGAPVTRQCALKYLSRNKIYVGPCNAAIQFFCINASRSISRTHATWFKAREACVNAGGDLPGLDAPGTGEYRWIGLRKRQWIWRRENNTFVEMIYTHWGSNSYTSDEDHQCVLLSADGRWSNLRCDEKRPAFICQRQKVVHGAEDSDSYGVSTGAIVGGIGAGLLILGVTVVLVVLYFYYFRGKELRKQTNESNSIITTSDVSVAEAPSVNVYDNYGYEEWTCTTQT